jgi:hypothetical protein
MGYMKPVQGPQYGSLWWLTVIDIASVALLLGIAGLGTWENISAAVVGMLILSVVIHKTAVITPLILKASTGG